MDAKKVKVLFIRKNQAACSPLMDRLGRSGCECRLATSGHEVSMLLDNHVFDLVLGPIRLNTDSLYPLIGLLDGSRTTLFFFQAVERGCWWLPALRRGLNCFGAPAYRSGEFLTVLDNTIEEIRSGANMAVETQLLMALRKTGSVVTLPYCHNVPGTKLPMSARSLNLTAQKALG